MKYQAFVFDFDGTLADSVPGIVVSLKLLMEQYKREPLTAEQERACVGPPIHRSFSETLGFEQGDMEDAISAYRSIFQEHALPALRAFDGIPALLQELKDKGARIGIASCKVKDTVVQQAQMLNIAPYVDVFGGTVPEEGLFEKTDVLNKTLFELNVPRECAVMIGDRKYDLIGANEAGVDGIGVLYSEGASLDEMLEYRPKAIARSVQELRKILLEEE